MQETRRRWIIAAALAAVVVAGGLTWVIARGGGISLPAAVPSATTQPLPEPTAMATPSVPRCELEFAADLAPVLLTSETIAPSATSPTSPDVSSAAVTTLASDSALVYDIDSENVATPIGTLERSLPWEPETVQPVVVLDALESPCLGLVPVLVPAREGLPSQGNSAAQTVRWISTDAISAPTRKPATIEVDLAARTLTFTDASGQELARWEGIVAGGPGEETPQGTGFVLSMYQDPEYQPWTAGETILLTSLHSQTSDGTLGNNGEIGIHFSTSDTAGSAGCVRVPLEAARFLDEHVVPGDLVIVK